MQVLIISGSPRANSNSFRLGNYFKQVFTAQAHQVLDVIDLFENDLPRVGRPKPDPEALTPFQERLINGWRAAQIVVIIAPEYNWTTSGELIDMLHVLGGKPFLDLFDKKVFAIAGSSSGRGGKMPAVQISNVLSKIISFSGNISLVSPLIMEAHDVNQNIDTENNSTGNQRFEKTALDFINYCVSIAQLLE